MYKERKKKKRKKGRKKESSLIRDTLFGQLRVGGGKCSTLMYKERKNDEQTDWQEEKKKKTEKDKSF